MSDEQQKEREPNFFLWTIQIPRWNIHKTAGMKLVDITVKSGIKAFAPHWFDLKQYKTGQMSEAEYTERYLDKMYESMQEDRAAWDRLSVYPYAVYGCYCKEDDFCHRHLFKNLAKAHLEGMGWTPKLMGEYVGVLDVEIPERFVRAYPVSPRKKIAA
jgi:hypothetical protein